ncbi:MAG: DUF4160 domain-containing protein [Syntrophobacteraceae bacterium]|jgi:hypothetical protein|nr:DUF4160 domain-containing protein [Syntrophobacteraceae bacterium]
MPTIKRFPNCRIEIRFGDHNPPHFHVVMNDGRQVSVEIGNLRAITGTVKLSEIAPMVKWAQDNQETIENKWKEFNP